MGHPQDAKGGAQQNRERDYIHCVPCQLSSKNLGNCWRIYQGALADGPNVKCFKCDKPYEGGLKRYKQWKERGGWPSRDAKSRERAVSVGGGGLAVAGWRWCRRWLLEAVPKEVKSRPARVEGRGSRV